MRQSCRPAEDEREPGLAATARGGVRCCGGSSCRTGCKRNSETESVEERLLGAGEGLQGGKADKEERDDAGGATEPGPRDPRSLPRWSGARAQGVLNFSRLRIDAVEGGRDSQSRSVAAWRKTDYVST